MNNTAVQVIGYFSEFSLIKFINNYEPTFEPKLARPHKVNFFLTWEKKNLNCV